MADNVTITQGSGKTIATEDVSDVQHQKVKVEFGGDGVATMVSSSDPLPVTASSLPLPSGASTSAKQDTEISHLATLAGAVAGSEIQVDIVSGGGAGTQYTEGDTDASITGTAVMWEDTGDTLRAVSAAKPLPVSDAGGSLTVDGTVAVTNAGITTIAGAVSGTEMQVDVVGSLPAGTNNIGDVDVLSVVPGTGATNLGKARDSAVGATDTGVAVMMQMLTDSNYTDVDEGDYGIPSMSSWREVRTRDQRSRDIQSCNDYTQFSALNADTSGLANSLNHVFGTGAVTFDKSGTATVFGGIQDTITALNISEIFEDGAFAGLTAYIPSITNLDYFWLRLGTDSSNYNEWRWEGSDLTAASWNTLRQPTVAPNAFAGNGWDTSSITYVAVGVAMNAAGNTLSGIIVDHIHFVGGRVTDTVIEAAITSSVNTPNINVQRIGGVATDTGNGVVGGGTQRVTIASDTTGVLSVDDNGVALTVDNGGTFAVQVDGAALTSLQLIDDTIATDGSATPTKGVLIAGQDGTNAQTIKTDTSGELQVDVLTMPTVAVTQSGTWDEVGINDSGNSITVDYATTGSGTSTGALRVELPTNGTGTVGLNAGTNAIGKLAANSGVDIGDVDVTSVIAGTGATNLGKAEDAGHTTGDTGVFNLGVRVDSPNVALTNTDADYSPITTNKLGSLRTAALEDDLATAATTHTYKYYTNAGAVTDGIIWSPAAGKRWFLTSLTINVSAAATVTIEDDVAAGDVVRFKFEFAANSGITIPFPEVPMFSGEDAADLLVTTTAGNVYITAVGYEI